ncbi:MAG: penicillin acylase family protein [Chlorobi bacterium]|nr:penicillin acylase family protein [Chlorobiota bacterium]
MNTLKKAIKILLALIIISSIAGFFILKSYKPQYSGELKLPELKEEVKVYFDKYGIPHIYAQNKADLYYSFGYLHAQERLFQMEILRRVASGRLSEILGEATLEYDKLFRTLQVNKTSEEAVKKYLSDKNKPFVQDVDNYLKGINEFLFNGKTSIEYSLIGIEKTKFTREDLFNIAGYMAFSFAEGFKLDPMITKIKHNLGDKYLKDIISSYVPGTERIKNNNDSLIDYSALSQISLSTMKMIEDLEVPFFEGSNSWVVSGDRTESGKVLFANDTHMAYSQPAVWYEAHLECPNFNLYGNFVAGVPFSLLGHNRNLAWGLTMFENDDVDFFFEEINPNDSTQYKSNDTWKNFEIITETIKVKGAEDVKIKIRKTERGTIINDVIKGVGESPISLFWTFTHSENKIIEAFYELNNSQNIKDVEQAVEKIAAPGLNVMYGDKFGNIAYWAAAKITKYKDSANTSIIQSYKDAPLGFYDFSKNPRLINPKSGYVYSANNQPDSVDGVLYPGYYAPEDRAKKIVDFFNANNTVNVEKIKKLQTNVKSDIKPITANIILEDINKDVLSKSEQYKKAYEILKSWDGNHLKDDIAPTIYYRLLRKILEFTMIDELGEEDFEFMAHGHTSYRSIPVLIRNKESAWWDNIKTKKQETRSDIFTMAFDSTIVALNSDLGNDIDKWTWGRVHTVEYQHAIGKKVNALRSTFNVGPFNVWGGRSVLNNINFTLSNDGKYKASSGPAMRTIIDFSDVENKAYSVIPTGQSGVFMSKHYSDQAEMYNKGEYRKQMMNKQEIIEKSNDVLVILPE